MKVEIPYIKFEYRGKNVTIEFDLWGGMPTGRIFINNAFIFWVNPKTNLISEFFGGKLKAWEKPHKFADRCIKEAKNHIDAKIEEETKFEIFFEKATKHL